MPRRSTRFARQARVSCCIPTETSPVRYSRLQQTAASICSWESAASRGASSRRAPFERWAARCWGRLAPQSDAERATCQAAGLDLPQIFTANDLVSSDEMFFTATGITDGPLLTGVRYPGNQAETHSLLLRCKAHTRRKIHAEHLIETEKS
jgi:hypothetical protein